MNRDNIDNLIVYFTAIDNYAKDIHYNCTGSDFYGNHLFADRFTNNLSDYIDQLKEICLLGHGFRPLHSSEYLRKAADIIPSDIDFKNMRDLMLNCLQEIETIKSVSKGDDNLIGALSQDIQNNVGLLNIMFGDMQNV